MRSPVYFARTLCVATAALGAGLGLLSITPAVADQPLAPSPSADDAEPVETPAVLDYTMQSLGGEDIDLSQYHGQVVLMVNTASKCGLTPQYQPLQGLHETYADQGLAVLGFPANNFGKQEPGTDTEIEEFCEQNFGVEFTMFSKVSVKGGDICPLYAFLTSEDTNPGMSGPINWNFEKFLISREGTVVARFAPRTLPDADEVIAAIEAELAKPVPPGIGGDGGGE